MLFIWEKISFLGIDTKIGLRNLDTKRKVLFNQVLFIGIFATLSQIPMVWPFIKERALIFIPVVLILVLCMKLNSIKRFKLSKYLFNITIYSSAIVTTILIGGSTLYHIQAILVFLANLLLFDLIKDKWILIIGIPVCITCLYIGELNPFHTTSFETHFWTPVVRTLNISSLFILTSVFALFFIQLNKKSELELTNALEKILNQQEKLNTNNLNLEEKIRLRTAEIKTKNEILKEKNKEKEILLKEIHHRVRNNLQIIISLINLQISQEKSDENYHTLYEIRGRVEAMSIVHKKMYETNNFKDLKLNEYAETIIQSMSKLHGVNNLQYNLEIDNDIVLQLESAIPLGLILNEIISNFFKHVHYADKQKSFNITILNAGNTINVKYNDNGPGFNSDKKRDSLGIQLIESLTEQLDGKFHFFNENGAVYDLLFPN